MTPLVVDIPEILAAIKTSMISSLQVTPQYRNKSFLRQKYLEERLSAKQIAAQIFSARSTIVHHLNGFSIPLRDEDEQRKLRPGQLRFGERYFLGQVQPHKGELKTIEQMRAVRKKGYSYHAIANVLQARGYDFNLKTRIKSKCAEKFLSIFQIGIPVVGTYFAFKSRFFDDRLQRRRCRKKRS